MATAQNIIDSATLKLGLRAQGTSYVTYDSSSNDDAFTVLQDLISQLAAKNQLHIPTPSDVTDALDLYNEQIRSLKLLLARDLIVEFRVTEVPRKTLEEIEEAENDLEADNNISIEVDMSDLAFGFKYDITTDV